jgi:hypothetical protein
MRFAITEEAGVELGLDQNLLELGLDSLRAAQFASQARRPTRAPPAPLIKAPAFLRPPLSFAECRNHATAYNTSVYQARRPRVPALDASPAR